MKIESGGPPEDSSDERLLELIRGAQRSLGEDTPPPSEEAVLAYLEDRAGAGHLEEIRLALERRPSLAGWLAELVEIRDAQGSEQARVRFDSASPPPLPASLLRQGREGLTRSLGRTNDSPPARVGAWLLAGWATTATAAAAVLMIVQLQRGPDSGREATLPLPSQTPTHPPSSGQGSPSIRVGILPARGIVLRSTTRQASSPIDTLTMPSPVTWLRMTAEPPADAPNERSAVLVQLVGVDGHLFFEQQTPIQELSGDGRIVLVSDHPFPSGGYVLTMRGTWPGAAAEPLQYPFFLRYESPR